MSDSQVYYVRRDMYGSGPDTRDPMSDVQAQMVAFRAKTLENFLASGLGSRGGPNKLSNKLIRNPTHYLSIDEALEFLLATGIASRGGPNKESNKLRSRPESYRLH